MPSRTEPAGRTKIVADVALYRDDRVLLVKYRDVGRYDGQSGWFLPDDYVRRLEHPEVAGLRILREQVGVDLPSLDIGFIESFESKGAWHLVFHFVGRLPGDAVVAAVGNTSDVQWFDRSGLPDRSAVAHDGWAIDVVRTLARPRDEVAHVRSVVD